MKPPSALVPVIAGFGVVLLLLLAVAAIGVTHIHRLSDQITAIVGERNLKAFFATGMHGLHQARHQSLLLAANLEDPFARDEELMRFSQLAGDFIRLREQFLALPLDGDEWQMWQEARRDVREVETIADAVVGLLQRGDLPTARVRIREALQPKQEKLMRSWGALLELQREKNQAALRDATAARDRAMRLATVLAAAAMLVGAIVAVFVIRMSRRLEKELFAAKERAQVTLRAIGDGVLRFDRDGTLRYLNPAMERLLGIDTGSGQGKAFTALLRLHERDGRADLASHLLAETLHGRDSDLPDAAILTCGLGVEREVAGRCSPIRDEDGEIGGGVLVLRDVSEQRELARRLAWQAEHDALTGLHNRHAFEQRVTRVLASRRAGDLPLSLLFIDLDYFKGVNDHAGHAAGDEFLRRIAGLMLCRIRATDFLARLGGDEFGLLLTACPHDMAEQIAGSLRDGIASLRLQWNGQTHQVGASIGVVHVPPHWSSLDACLAAADAACYRAKQSGRNAIVVHAEDA